MLIPLYSEGNAHMVYQKMEEEDKAEITCCTRLQCLLIRQSCLALSPKTSQSEHPPAKKRKKEKKSPLFFLRRLYALFANNKNLHIPYGFARFFVTTIDIFLKPTAAMFLFEYIFPAEYICKRLPCNPYVMGGGKVSFRLLRPHLTTICSHNPLKYESNP